MLQEEARMLAEMGMSSIQQTNPGLGPCQDQGLKGKASGLGYFLGGQ